MLPIRTILHPTDFSGHSDCAFRVACALARDYGARVVVLHVAPPPALVFGEGVLPPEPAESREQLGQQLHQVQSGDPKVPVEHRLAEGDAATEVLRVAEEVRCDAIVMGTHGRTGLGRLLVGSVAEQVVRRAPCPVLTLKVPSRLAPPPEESGTALANQGTDARK